MTTHSRPRPLATLGLILTTTISPALAGAPAGLTAEKEDQIKNDNGDGLASPGEKVAYTVRVANNGGANATTVRLQDILDGRTTLASVGGGGRTTTCSPCRASTSSSPLSAPTRPAPDLIPIATPAGLRQALHAPLPYWKSDPPVGRSGDWRRERFEAICDWQGPWDASCFPNDHHREVTHA